MCFYYIVKLLRKCGVHVSQWSHIKSTGYEKASTLVYITSRVNLLTPWDLHLPSRHRYWTLLKQPVPSCIESKQLVSEKLRDSLTAWDSTDSCIWSGAVRGRLPFSCDPNDPSLNQGYFMSNCLTPPETASWYSFKRSSTNSPRLPEPCWHLSMVSKAKLLLNEHVRDQSGW